MTEDLTDQEIVIAQLRDKIAVLQRTLKHKEDELIACEQQYRQRTAEYNRQSEELRMAHTHTNVTEMRLSNLEDRVSELFLRQPVHP